jgi:tetratricopeptide (TPR) repeat protein
MITEEPECDRRFRWFYYVARDLKQGGKPEEALPYFYQARDGNGFWEERAHSAVEIGRAYMEMKDYNKSLIAGFEALKVCDGWRDPYYIIGDAYYWMGVPMKAIAWFQHCLMVPRPRTILWLWEDLYTWLPQCQLSYTYEQLGRREEALLWAKEELKNAPENQQSRILSRIKTLEAKR